MAGQARRTRCCFKGLFKTVTTGFCHMHFYKDNCLFSTLKSCSFPLLASFPDSFSLDPLKKGFCSLFQYWHYLSLPVWPPQYQALLALGLSRFPVTFQWISFKIWTEEFHGGHGSHLFLLSFLIFLQRLLFWDRILLNCPIWSWTLSVGQADLKLRHLPPFSSQWQRLEVCQ